MKEFDILPSAVIPEGLSEADYHDLIDKYNLHRRHLRSSAKSIADKLLQQLLRDDRSVDFSQLRDAPAPTADIEYSLQKLANLVHHLRLRRSDSIRCIEVEGSFIPISIDDALIYRQGQTDSPNGIFKVDIKDALSGVRRQLTSFLVNRLASRYLPIGGITGGMNSMHNLLSVKVSSHSVGALVSYSPAYFINYMALGAPTSPVKGAILPGRYTFRLTTRGPRYLIDQQTFDIPPVFEIPLMI
jgi:hypothetical protein